MQHIYENNSLSHHGQEHYIQPSIHSRYQYQHSLSPQQSPTSDADDVSTPSIHHQNHPFNSKIIKKKKQAKKKRKDPNEPQKPVSPYALFFRDTQNDIKKKLASPSFGEISKVVAHMWENIEPELKEQYKHRAAAAKKEYLKQLAAYRAVQVSHQSPNMSHFLNQTALSLHPQAHSRQSKTFHAGPVPIDHPPPPPLPPPAASSSSSSSHSMQQFCSPPSHPQQYNNYHYINSYCQESSHGYPSDHSMFFPQQIYAPYDGHDHLHYGSNRSTGELEHHSPYYSASYIDPTHYTDLTSSMASRGNHRSMDKHYESIQHGQHRSTENRDDEVFASSVSALPIRNENDFHWHSTACSGTQW